MSERDGLERDFEFAVRLSRRDDSFEPSMWSPSVRYALTGENAAKQCARLVHTRPAEPDGESVYFVETLRLDDGFREKYEVSVKWDGDMTTTTAKLAPTPLFV